jgi:hypothetical protein
MHTYSFHQILILPAKQTLFISFLLLLSCKDDAPASAADLYFPPAGSSWEKVSPASVGWDESSGL